MTESSQADLNDAVSRLAQVWSKRSPAERAAFADRLSNLSAPPVQDDVALRTVRERAALCGAVSPFDLAGGLDHADASRALDLLAPEFDRIHTAGTWKWTLRTAPRRQALLNLAQYGRLPSLLAEVATIHTDRAGQLLRQMAENWSEQRAHGADSEGADNPATVLQALTWVRALGGFDGDVAEAQRRAAVRLLSEGYTLLVRYGVFGRERELAKLRDFAEGLAKEDTDEVFTVPLLTLTGIGGAGKSTVLGALVKPYLDRIEARDFSGPAVVVIDFDRVTFRPSAALELSFELTRQLGCAAPAAAADFAALRSKFRDEQRRAGNESHVGNVRLESTSREASAFESEAASLVRVHELRDRPVLLVLDTFEEWQRERLYPVLDPMSWSSPEGRILDWIRRLRFSMGLRNLRVIVSGRAGLSEAGDLGPSAIGSQLVVGDLERPAARALLSALGIAIPDALKLADFVGGNPLTLHVAARFYRGLSEEAQRELVAGEPLQADELTADIRKAVLYERFLAHIPDKQVRKLAHPGLLLRRITPELVRHVLAGPCDLGELSQGESTELTRRLGDEVWLVQQGPHGLYHRREVRRPMLRLMASDPAYLEIARQINAAAAAWYESAGHGRDRLPRDEAEIEAFYHSQMLATGEDSVVPARGPERDRWLLLAQQLGEAVDELPEKVAAQVRVLRGDQIHDQDAEWLPEAIWQMWIERRGRAQVDNGEPAAALKLFSTRQPRVIPSWLSQACSDVGQWSRFWSTTRSLGRVHEHYVPCSDRYALLDALISKNRVDLESYQVALAAYFRAALRGTEHPLLASVERVFCGLLVDLDARAGDPGAAMRLVSAVQDAGQLPRLNEADHGRVDKFPVDQLRRIMSWIGMGAGGSDFVIDNPASFFRPDQGWMRDFAAFIGLDDRADSGYRLDHAFGGIPSGQTTHELLGEWSIAYERNLGPAPIRLRRMQARNAADLIYVLRGDNPELRPAIQLALAGPAQGAGMRELAVIAKRLVPVLGSDLVPSALADGTGSDRRTLTQLVEYVDRSGVMRPFLAHARRVWPEERMLRQVTRAFHIWDDANLRVLAALAGKLRDESQRT